MTGKICVTFADCVFVVSCSFLEMPSSNILTQTVSTQLQSYPKGLVVLEGNSVLLKFVLAYLKGNVETILQVMFQRHHSWMSLTSMVSRTLMQLRFFSNFTEPQVHSRQEEIDRINTWDVYITILMLAKKCANLHIKTRGEMLVTVKQGWLQGETFTCSAKTWKTLCYQFFENFDCVCEDCNQHFFKGGLKVISVKEVLE